MLPNRLQEQQKIASVFSILDDLLQKTDLVIDLTQRLKRGLMKKLFTQGIGYTKYKRTEIGEIPLEWKIVKMKELVRSYKNGIYKKSSHHGHGVLNIRMFNIQDGKINSNKTPLLEVTHEEMLDYGLKENDILLNRVNSADLVGKAGILGQEIGPAVFDSMIIRIRLLNELCVPKFLNYFLNTKMYYRQIEGKIKHAIGQSSINQDDLNEILIGLPLISEQHKIISIISGVDNRIEVEKSMKSNIRCLKSGLMQTLLTGKLRVKV